MRSDKHGLPILTPLEMLQLMDTNETPIPEHERRGSWHGPTPEQVSLMGKYGVDNVRELRAMEREARR